MSEIEQGRVLDIYPDMGCVQYRVRGVRTGIDYVGCAHMLVNVRPAVYDMVTIESRDVVKDGHAFIFSKGVAQ